MSVLAETASEPINFHILRIFHLFRPRKQILNILASQIVNAPALDRAREDVRDGRCRLNLVLCPHQTQKGRVLQSFNVEFPLLGNAAVTVGNSVIGKGFNHKFFI